MMSNSSKMKEMVGGCCVCSDERGWDENPLVYCDGQYCNVAVHQACYGIIQVPTGPWFCRKCESQERAARVKCELCPLKDGALKRTDNGGWCHVVCALFIPEAWFANVQTMEPIMLKNVPPDRFNRLCYICEENNREVSKASAGACMPCNRNGCKYNFHVTCAQAQGLLCEEAGNYGDNVKYCGYCSYHFKKLKDSNIKTIPAFKPIPADNATPDSTPEKSYNEPKVNISAEHKNRESFAARQLSALNQMGGDLRRSRESTPNSAIKNALMQQNNGDMKSPADISRPEKSSKSTPQDKPSKSIPPDKVKSNGLDKDTKQTDKQTDKPSTSTSSDTKVIADSKFSKAEKDESPGKLFSPLPEGQVITTMPATTQVAFPTSLDGIMSMVNSTNSSNTPSTPTDSEASNMTSRSRRSRAGSLDKDKKKRGKVQTTRSGRVSRTSISEDNTEPSPPTTKRSKQKSESIQITSAPSIVTATTSITTTTNSTLGPPTLSVFGGEPTFPNPIMKAPFTQADTGSLVPLPLPLSDMQQGTSQLTTGLNLTTADTGSLVSLPLPLSDIQQGTSQLTTGLNLTTVSSLPSSSSATSGLKISNGPVQGSLPGPLQGPPNPFSSPLPFISPSQTAKHSSETPTTMEELLEMQWEQGSNFLMEQGQHFDIASLLNCLHKLKSENKKLEEYVRNLVSRRDHLLAVNARLSLPFGNSHMSSSGAAAENSMDSQQSGAITQTKLRIPNGTESISEDENSDDSHINVVDTPTDGGHTDNSISYNTPLSSESLRNQLSLQKHTDQYIATTQQMSSSSNKDSTAHDKT